MDHSNKTSGGRRGIAPNGSEIDIDEAFRHGLVTFDERKVAIEKYESSDGMDLVVTASAADGKVCTIKIQKRPSFDFMGWRAF